MSKINLLPWREQLKTKQTQEFWLGVAFSVGLTVALLYGVISYYGSLQKEQSQRNQYLEQQTSLLDQQIGEIRKVKEQKQSLQERIGLIQKLQESRNLTTQIFNHLPSLAPSGIYLDELQFIGSKISIDGRSEANYRVASLMRNVEKQNWLSTPDISSIIALPTDEDSLMDLSRFRLSFDVQVGLEGAETDPQGAEK